MSQQAIVVRQDNVVSGIVLIVLTVFAMSTADATIKYFSATFTLWQVFVVRSLIVIPVLIGILAFAGHRGAIVFSGGWPFLRGMLLAFMYIAIYAAIPVLSLSTIAASLYTAPLFIALFSALLAGEPVGRKRWVAILAGFIGVLMILRPGTDAFTPEALIPVIAAILYALAAILTRTKCAGEPPLVLALALNCSLLLVGSFATLVIALWQPALGNPSSYAFIFGDWVIMGKREWEVIAILAALMVGISVGLAKAYQSASPTIIATFDYSYLLFAAFWGFFIFGQEPDALAVLGVLTIAAAGILVL